MARREQREVRIGGDADLGRKMERRQPGEGVLPPLPPIGNLCSAQIDRAETFAGSISEERAPATSSSMELTASS